MGVNLSTATCFLPFNNSVTEDLVGKTEWEIANNTNADINCGIVDLLPNLHTRKSLYLQNLTPSSGPVYVHSNAENTLWNFGTSDFTISFWARRLSNTYEHVFFWFPIITFGMIFNVNIGMQVKLNNTVIIGSNNNIFGMRFDWHYYALIRHNGVITLYIDGKNIEQYNIGSASVGNNTGEMRIGQSFTSSGDENYCGGCFFMSEFIIDIGHAYYIDEFTPQSFLNSTIINNLIVS